MFFLSNPTYPATRFPAGWNLAKYFALNVGWHKRSASTKCANVSPHTVIVDVYYWWMRRLIHPTGSQSFCVGRIRRECNERRNQTEVIKFLIIANRRITKLG